MSTLIRMCDELEILFRKSMAVVEIIESQPDYSGGPMSDFRGVILETYENGNLDGMRIISKDMFEWAASLPKEPRSEINSRWLDISRSYDAHS